MSLVSITVPALGALYAAPATAGFHLLAAFSVFAQTAAPVAVTALWQGVAVALILALCLRLAPRVSAAHRFAVWAAAFAVVAAMPFLPALAHSAAESIAPSVPVGSALIRPWLQFDLDSHWGFMVAALWLLASAFRAADLAFHSLRLRRLWKSASPVEIDTNIRALLSAACRSRRPVEICTTRELDRPSVIGFLAPRILIPDWLFQRLTPGEVEHVVLHEAEHLRRRDDWTNLLQKLSLVLFPLNPALVWMERRLCREREMACDEGVVRRTQAPREYAACLTSLAERSLNRRAQALSLGAFERRPELVHRVHSILRRKRTLHPLAARAWMGLVGCGLIFVSVELARCPQIVAFVPHPSTPAAGLASAQQGAASLAAASQLANALSRPANPASVADPVRMIETKAIMPDRSQSSAPRPAVMRRSGPQLLRSAGQIQIASRATASNTPREVLLMAESPAAVAAAPARQQVAQWVVFTAWRQVQTVSHRSKSIADYDDVPDAAPQNAPAGSQAACNRSRNTDAADCAQARPATQIAVTQLILTVYPAGSAPSASNRSHAKVSHSGSPAALPFDGGWLVFEL
jgi:bla regulator protein blaR1